MKIDEYAWNKHEQKLKIEQMKFKVSSPKIKIADNTELRNQIEEKIDQLPQKIVAQWALKVAIQYIDYLDDHLKDDSRIILGIETLEERIKGNIQANELRRVGFLVNGLSKESKTDVSKFASRTIAQAIATGHMRGHAMVSSDYAIKVTNVLSNNSLEKSTKERERQLSLLTEQFDNY